MCLQGSKLETQRQFRAVVDENDFIGELTILGLATQPVAAVTTKQTERIMVSESGVYLLLREVPVDFMRNLTRTATARFYRSTDESLRDINLVLGGNFHNLKNPISTAINAVEMIEERRETGFADSTGLIRRSFERMLALVQDVLDTSRGKTNLRIGTIQMRELIAELDELILARLRRGAARQWWLSMRCC